MKMPIQTQDLHPILRFNLDYGAEITASFFESLQTSGDSRKAIRLTDAEEVWDVVEKWNELKDGRKAPVYAKKHMYRVGFEIETNGRFRGGISCVLQEVHSEAEARPHLERIAAELKGIFKLDYDPNIFRNDSYLK